MDKNLYVAQKLLSIFRGAEFGEEIFLFHILKQMKGM